MKTLPLIYKDDYLVAVNKPSGLLVHRSDMDRYEQDNAMKLVRNQLGQWIYPFHRLDKATSGVLLFALDRETARFMTQAFTAGEVSKSYLAVVRGFAPEDGRIDHALKDRWDKMTDQKTDRDKPAKDAVTEYRRLAIVELPYPVGRYETARYSLIRAAPLTGRTNQIRRHMKHIFHPVVGDTTYGDGKQNVFFRERFDCHRLLLHAQGLSFIHPYSGQRLLLQAPLNDAFDRLCAEFRWDTGSLS
jgi:tRNA pseudouridine65 synthase